MRKLTLYAGIALSLDTQTKPLVKGEGGRGALLAASDE